MTDHDDTIGEAKNALKKAGAAFMVKKERLEAEISALEKRRAELAEGLGLAESAGDAGLLGEVRSTLDGIDEQLSVKKDALAQADADLSGAVTEMKEMDGLKSHIQRASLRSELDTLSSTDPYDQSPQARALENVRDHATELEARVEVEREMNAEREKERDLERRLRALDREQKDAEAKEKLAALKAARQTKAETPADAAPDDATPDDATPKPPKRPKRTL